MNRGAHIGELMFRHIRNGLSEQEAAELLAWRREKPGNEALFRRQTDPGYLRETIREIYEGRDQGLEKLLRQCPPGKAAAPAMVMDLSVWKIAAMLLVLAVLYSLLNMDIDTTGSSKPPVARQVNFLDANGLSKSLDDIRKDMREGYADGRKARMLHMIREFTAPYSDSAALGRFNTIVTHDDGHCLLLLPDGGRCWQNRNSFVSYPVNFFNDTPKLRIRGEAYVEVTQNKRARAPFEVRAGQIGVIAFNGSFNIRAYTDSLIIVTAIGSTLEIKLPASSVSLQSGEQLIIAGGRTELNKQADIGQVLEWERKEGR